MRRSAWFFSTMLSGVVGASLFALVSARAQGLPVATPPLPAVDDVNGKAELLGGAFNGRGLFGAAGSFTAPLGQRYGFQIDGLASPYNGSLGGGVGAHLFWRDPYEGLLGLYAAHAFYGPSGGASLNNAAVEFERYWNRWTLQGIAGVEWGNGGVVFEQTGTDIFSYPVGNFTDYAVSTRVFDQINLNYYFTDNAMLSIGHRYVGGKNALALGAEWALPHMSIGSGLTSSLYVEGRVGEGGYAAATAGVRVYFDRNHKSLIDQHREGDPSNWLPDTLFGILNNAGSSILGCNVSGYIAYDAGINECAI